MMNWDGMIKNNYNVLNNRNITSKMNERTILSLAESYQLIYEGRKEDRAAATERLARLKANPSDNSYVRKAPKAAPSVNNPDNSRDPGALGDAKIEARRKLFNKQNAGMRKEDYDYLLEEAIMVADYFYVEGLNEDGLEILIDELGLEEFVEWVEEINDEYTYELTEARAARRAKKNAKSYEQVKAEIDAKEKAKAAAKAAKSPVRAAAVTKAKETQNPTPAATPKRSVLDNLAKGIFSASDAVKKGRENAGKAFRAGMERHNKATQTAGKLAGETAKVAGKAGKIAGAFGKGVSSGVKTAGSVAKKVTEEEIIIGYLLDEGFASDVEKAEILMQHMSDEWLASILSE